MNSTTLTGHLQNIISYRVFTTQNGKSNPSLIFSMYTTRKYRSRKTNRYPLDFHTVICHGHDAQYTRQYGQKGAVVAVHGSLENHSYNNVTTEQINADSVELPRPSRNTGKFTTRQPRNQQAPSNMPRTNNNGFNRGAGSQNRPFNQRPQMPQNSQNQPMPNNAPRQPMRNTPANGSAPMGSAPRQGSAPTNGGNTGAGTNTGANTGNGTGTGTSNGNSNRFDKKTLTPDGKDLPF